MCSPLSGISWYLTSVENIDIIPGRDIGNWWGPDDFANAKVAWRSNNPETPVGLYASAFPLSGKNPIRVKFRIASPDAAWMIGGISIRIDGGLILSDRYTTSNAVHQGSKLPDEELPEFFRWLYDLEYGKMGLPKPDMVIYLDVDVETSLSRMARRQQNTNTSADIHEQDAEYLRRCLKTARKAADYYGWVSIDYMKDGQERDVDEKNLEIFQIILRKLGLD